MASKTSMILCSAGVLFLTAFLLGANPGPRAATQWEYGIYTELAVFYEWQETGRRVQATNPTIFFEKMGLPPEVEGDARTGRVRAKVLNYLGQQSWELIQVQSAENNRDVYWFKRPK